MVERRRDDRQEGWEEGRFVLPLEGRGGQGLQDGPLGAGSEAVHGDGSGVAQGVRDATLL